MKIKGIILLALAFLTAYLLAGSFSDYKEIKSIEKTTINGVNFVAPMNEIGIESFHSLDRIDAGWVAIIPYAYTPRNSSEVTFYHNHPHWWGEGVEGTIAQIILAKRTQGHDKTTSMGNR